ncbi:MAG: radical SAM protein [Planctomycetota bacterium]
MTLRVVSNPPNPWRTQAVEWLGDPPPCEPRVMEEEARSILSENESPDLGFRYSVNPYRGCFHACAYCYARPTHEYLDLGAGTDFERVIVAKINAPELLARAFAARTWRGELIVFSGVTDCYQPLEASYQLTRRLLEVCRDYRNPVGIITKGPLIRRDLDLLVELARDARLSVFVSTAFADATLARALEPSVAAPAARFATIRALADAGIVVGVAVAPIIPGLNDDQVPEILTRAREAGATRTFRNLLRLPTTVRTVFEERLRAQFPARADRVLANLIGTRGGERLGGHGFGRRMVGQGPRWQAVDRLFAVTARRLGYDILDEGHAHDREQLEATTFRRPVAKGTLTQGELFTTSSEE